MLSGYKNDLYVEAEQKFGWNRYEKETPNHAAGGEKKRIMTECVWTNYEASAVPHCSTTNALCSETTF